MSASILSYALCWLPRTGMCKTFGACFALHTSNLASALQVRGVGVGCQAPYLRSVLRILQRDLVPPDDSMNLHTRPFRVG